MCVLQLEEDRSDHNRETEALRAVVTSQLIELASVKQELKQFQRRESELSRSVVKCAADLDQLAPSVTSKMAIADGLVKWEVRGVLRGFRWENAVSVKSTNWIEDDVGWRLELDKPANCAQVKLSLRLIDGKGRSGAKGTQTIRLQRVAISVAAKTDDGFLSGTDNSVRWISFEGDDFDAGSARSNVVGITLSAIQLAGCYNAQRDSILIIVE